MTDPDPPASAGAGRQSPEAAPGGILPQAVVRRRRDIDVASLLIGIMLLGLALILTLALTGWIQTPWQTFPAGVGGVDFRRSLEDAFSIVLGIPAAVAVIVIGHVALYVARRIPPRHPDRAGAGRVVMTAIVAVCLATAYLALAMQVYYLAPYLRML